ncbi:MAG: interleukin-like EMT inducer domain-containing protein [bacterium]
MDQDSHVEASADKAPEESSRKTAGTFTAVWLIPLVLFGFLVVLFWPVLTPITSHRSHIGGDLLTKDYPFRVFAMRELLHGRLPLWDEHLFGGWPGLANSELAVFYPFNVFLVPFWTERGFSYDVFQRWILLHLFFAGLGTAFLGRRYGLSNSGALLAGMAMMCSGFLVAHKIHSNIIQTIVWLPWVLLCIEKYLRSSRIVYAWLCGGCLICAYFGGHPQMATYLTLILVSRLIWEIAIADAEVRWTSVRRSIPVLFVVGLAVLVTMAQWLPMRTLIGQGERSSPTYRSSAEFSLPPEELVDTILPESAGFPGIWEGKEVFYWGIVTTFLALFCWPVFRWRGPSGFFILAGAIGFVLALGDATAAHRWAFDFVPGIAWLRAGSRWMVVVTLSVALAAGRGLDAITRDGVLTNSRAVRVYAFLGGAFFFCLLFFFLVFITQRFFVSAEAVAETTPLIRQLVWVLVCLALVAGALILFGLGKITAIAFSSVILLLVFLDLATVHGNREIEEGEAGYVWDEAVETILDDPTSGRVKIHFTGGTDRRQYNGQIFGLRELDGESPFRTRNYIEQRRLASLQDPLRINYHFLDLCHTKYLLTDLPNPGGPWRRIFGHLWQNPDVPPSVQLYGRHLVIDPALIPRLLTSESISAHRFALVGNDYFPQQEWGTRSIPNSLTGVHAPLLVLSVSGHRVRPQSVILIGGQDRSENRRGYNVVVVDPETGAVTASDCFDTSTDFDPRRNIVLPGAPENARMAEFFERIPIGHIVIAAVDDEATNILRENALRGLHSCGSGVDLRLRERMAHAMIGMKGMLPGTALEVVGATEALLMTDTADSWIQMPPSPHSSSQVTLEHAHFNARPIWETFCSTPASMLFVAPCCVGDSTPFLSIPVVVFSSPKDDSLPPNVETDCAGLIVGAKDWSPNRRGYNLASLSPVTGQVLATDSFDIGTDWDVATGAVVPGTPENSRMIRFLEKVPTGAVVLGAVRDEGCNILQPDTVDALRTVGCELDLRKRFRWSHAFVGVKGATPGTAVEISSSTNVIVYTVVRNPSLPEFNTYLPDLEPSRRVELLAQGIPLLLSKGAERLNRVAIESSGAVQSAEERAGETKSMFPKSLETNLGQGSENAHWSMIESSPESCEVIGSASRDGILFVSESFFPGWRAYLDGEEMEIFPVFRFFRGVRMPAGSHSLRMVYQPQSVTRGAALSCLGLIVWIGWGVWLILYRRRRI